MKCLFIRRTNICLRQFNSGGGDSVLEYFCVLSLVFKGFNNTRRSLKSRVGIYPFMLDGVQLCEELCGEDKAWCCKKEEQDVCNRQAAAQRMMVCLAFSRLRCPSRTTFVLTISAGSIYTVDRPIHTSTDTCHLESEFAASSSQQLCRWSRWRAVFIYPFI